MCHSFHRRLPVALVFPTSHWLKIECPKLQSLLLSSRFLLPLSTPAPPPFDHRRLERVRGTKKKIFSFLLFFLKIGPSEFVFRVSLSRIFWFRPAPYFRERPLFWVFRSSPVALFDIVVYFPNIRREKREIRGAAIGDRPVAGKFSSLTEGDYRPFQSCL